MRIVLLLLGVAALVLVAVLGRYEVVSVSDRGDAAVVRLDRWTGRAVLCSGRGCVSLKLALVELSDAELLKRVPAAARLPVASPTP